VLGRTVTNLGELSWSSRVQVTAQPRVGARAERSRRSPESDCLIFMIQNTDDVKLDFLFWSFTWPLWLLCLVMALVGAIAWFGLGVLRRHRRRKERRAVRRS
jgi:Lipopolysaccharide assembly protein A domain